MKVKAFLLTLFLSVAAVSLWAQEKYEYATVRIELATSKTEKIKVSKESGYEEQELPINSKDILSDMTNAMVFLNKMSTEGWELFSTENSLGSNTKAIYILRKKKN